RSFRSIVRVLLRVVAPAPLALTPLVSGENRLRFSRAGPFGGQRSDTACRSPGPPDPGDAVAQRVKTKGKKKHKKRKINVWVSWNGATTGRRLAGVQGQLQETPEVHAEPQAHRVRDPP